MPSCREVILTNLNFNQKYIIYIFINYFMIVYKVYYFNLKNADVNAKSVTFSSYPA